MFIKKRKNLNQFQRVFKVRIYNKKNLRILKMKKKIFKINIRII